jgi:F0F1-type ATP synthase delta subunit
MTRRIYIMKHNNLEQQFEQLWERIEMQDKVLNELERVAKHTSYEDMEQVIEHQELMKNREKITVQKLVENYTEQQLIELYEHYVSRQKSDMLKIKIATVLIVLLFLAYSFEILPSGLF